MQHEIHHGWRLSVSWLGLCTFAAILLAQPPAHSTITITTITGSSAVETEPTDATKYTIYGGTGGDDCGGSVSNTSTCNSCIDDPSENTDARFFVCNNNRIHDSLLLSISFTSNAKTGYPYIFRGSETVPMDPENSTALIQQGQTATIQVKWADICDGSCEGLTADLADSLKVGISVANDSTLGTDDDVSNVITVHVNPGEDPNDFSTAIDCDAGSTNGICSWWVNPGDEKVTIKEPESHSGCTFPGSQGGLKYKYWRFLYDENPAADGSPDWNKIRINGPNFYDIEIDLSTNTSDCSINLKTQRVNGLVNDREYFFKTALVDQAGNISQFTPDGASGDEYCRGERAGDNDCHIAMTGEVMGILANKKNCFIATAAYGSSLSQEVQTFRTFRDRFLVGTRWGRKLVNLYYDYGSEWALQLQKHETAKALVRAGLWPLWAFAWLSLHLGLVATLALLSSPLLTFYAVRARAQRKRLSK